MLVYFVEIRKVTMTIADETLKSPRIQRKRERARQRILDAAERLMRARGVDAVTIQDITEAADVGHGTFYTHFKTKMDVLVPIAEETAKAHTRRLDALTADMEDAAEVVSISVRHLLHAIEQDPLWTWFLCNSKLPMDDMRRGVGGSGARDILRGIDMWRFAPIALPVGETFLLGAMIGVVQERFTETHEDDTVEETARLLLRTLGIADEEAREIAYRPLPPLPPSD